MQGALEWWLMTHPSQHGMQISDDRAVALKGVPLRSVLLALVVFYAAATLLNGVRIYEETSRLPYGAWRTVWLTMALPIKQLSAQTRLDRPRAWMERHWAGKEPEQHAQE